MPAVLVKFDEFELDSAGFELRRAGRVIKLEKRPLELLIFLVEKQGQLVTRQEIADRVWGKGIFLDTEHAVNTAIRKVRAALRDDFEQPRFIQTVIGRGYRFVARTVIGTDGSEAVSAHGPDLSVVHRPSMELPSAQAPQAHSAEKRWILVFASVLTLGFIAYFVWQRIHARPSQPRHVMLAVLPFENLSGDPTQDYFGDGLTEEIITQLGALSPDRLGVIARTTAMAYKHTSKSVHQIGNELGVDYVLESSVRRDGDQVRISSQLIRTRDQVHVWAHSYDRYVSHSIALQEEVARAVAEQIKVKLSPTYGARTGPRPLDPEANEAYLRGRYFSNQFTAEGYRKAITYFQEAIARDSNFAEAYSGLADSYRFLVITDTVSPEDGELRARESAQRAVSLGENLAESHNSLAGVMMDWEWNWTAAETEYKRAIELNPSYSIEHRFYAAFLTTQKRQADAWEQINEAMRSDPLSLPNNAEMVRTLYYARDYDRAIEQAKKALQLSPNYYRTHFWLARVYEQKHMYNEALAEANKVLQAMPDSNLGLTEVAYSLAAASRQREARELLGRLEVRSKTAFVPAYNLAVIHIALGETDAALKLLQNANAEHDWAMFVLGVEPRLDPLRNDPQFQNLLRRLKLPQ